MGAIAVQSAGASAVAGQGAEVMATVVDMEEDIQAEEEEAVAVVVAEEAVAVVVAEEVVDILTAVVDMVTPQEVAVEEVVVAEEATTGATRSMADTLEVVPPVVDVEVVDLTPNLRHKLLLHQDLGNLGNNLTM
uniref:Uncharacterized protein n=1 Tax=Cuerna arida TaxID=1464854 RepID=A0A1B6GAY3_9HEMI